MIFNADFKFDSYLDLNKFKSFFDHDLIVRDVFICVKDYSDDNKIYLSLPHIIKHDDDNFQSMGSCFYEASDPKSKEYKFLESMLQKHDDMQFAPYRVEVKLVNPDPVCYPELNEPDEEIILDITHCDKSQSNILFINDIGDSCESICTAFLSRLVKKVKGADSDIYSL
ncbi:hypothetical protein [Neptuniibacter sp.]|uniref:hypothetical protein n=1 Tax=Neptuniibacter sp. TaxID=1962643 RepID=UPI003B5C7C03